MNLKEYVKKVEGLCIDYDWIYGHQCVDLIKHYSQNVLWIKLWSFGGSARNWWLNKENTFKEEFFEKIDLSNNNIPTPWDIIFWNKWKYWHVAIVIEANLAIITVLEQNMGNWDWKGLDDCIKITKYRYEDIYWWYRFRNFTEIKETMETSEFDKKIQKAVEFWIFNWKDLNNPATRWETALMCLRIFELLEK